MSGDGVALRLPPQQGRVRFRGQRSTDGALTPPGWSIARGPSHPQVHFDGGVFLTTSYVTSQLSEQSCAFNMCVYLFP